MFLSTFARESVFNEQQWRAEFVRGEWIIKVSDDRIAGLLGVTREQASPQDKHFLEYMWVSPEFRRSGITADLFKVAFERLSNKGIPTVWLWVLDGNDVARRLYLKRGFVSTGIKQPLSDKLSRSEELLRLALG
jgi:GNAT superfamily N-acetyltransferase